MGKYYINEVKCGVSAGGMACGPFPGNVIVSVNVTVGSRTFWLTNVEATGIPNFYMTDEDIFDRLKADDFDEDFDEYLGQIFVDSFDGINIGEYDQILESIEQNRENPASSLIRYIILLTRCPKDHEEDVIEMATGKYIDDLEIPGSDVE